MYFERFFDERLAQTSYLVGCQATGDALVIDPARDVTPYLKAAARQGLAIRKVTETHIHADFLSGARELVARTGAQLLLSDAGPAEWKYDYAVAAGARLLKNGERFAVGNLELEVLHTPGHTPEHIAFMLIDRPASSQPFGIFTGDFVFAGDVGRPDLLERAAAIAGTMEAGARTLFRSLQSFKTLPDYLQIWPGHGAGSACGKALGAVPSTTLGYEKLANWAFRIEVEDEFVAQVLAGQPDPPKYFAQMKRLNKVGPPLLSDVPQVRIGDARDLEALSGRARAGEVFLVDLRPAGEFAAGHLPGSLCLPLDKSFTTWAGWLLTYGRPIVLLGEAESLAEARRALSSIGLDRVEAFFATSQLAEVAGLETLPSLDAEGLERRIAGNEPPWVLDVRWHNEWKEQRIAGAHSVSLGDLKGRLGEIPRDRPIVVSCAAGGRSMIAASVLQASGFTQLANLNGGLRAWCAAGKPTIASISEARAQEATVV